MLRLWIAVLFSLLFVTSSPVLAADFATQVMEATFKLYHPDSTATCVLVRREGADGGLYLVTAAHVLERTKGETATLVLREVQPDGSYERRDHTIPVRSGETPRWVKHANQDVAVLKLVEPLPVSVTALPESALANAEQLKAAGVHLCSPLFVLTYPQRFEANGAGIPVARQGIFASPPTLPLSMHPTYLADFTTFAGDSGGPVFVPGEGDRPLVVGIVLAQAHQEEKTVGEYEEKLVRRPLGLGTVLHAQFVRQTLDAASQPPVVDGN